MIDDRVFRASARVRLTMRTEEFADVEPLESLLPAETEDPSQYSPVTSPVPPQEAGYPTSDDVAAGLRRNTEELSQLREQKSLMPLEQYTAKRSALLRSRARIKSSAAITEQRPVSVGGTPPDDLTVVGDILPISVSVERNGLATADTCSIEIDFIDAPFDPRMFRAVAVEAVLGVVSAEDYEAGMRGVRRDDGSLVSLVARPADGGSRGATRFVGFVDDWSVNYDEGGDTITLECRDMSAPLRDLKLNSGDSIDLSLPIDKGVQAFLDAVSPTTAGMRVRFLGEGDAPSPADAAPGTRYPRRGAKKRRNKRGDADMTLWDHITDVLGSVGFIPMVNGFDLIIAEPRTLFTSQGVRRMVYGQNLTSLGFKRHLMGVKVPTIEARCYDKQIGRTRWARFPVRSGERNTGIFGISNPPRPLRANEVTPSGANPTEAVRVIEVSKVYDPDVLARVARGAFEQIGRQEIEGNLSTGDVSSFGVPFEEADLLDARAGEPVEVLVVAAAAPGEDGAQSSLAELQALTRARREAYLLELGWPAKVARRFAALQDANAFQTVFRVLDVRLEWAAAEGLRVSMNFINYVEIREEAPSISSRPALARGGVSS